MRAFQASNKEGCNASRSVRPWLVSSSARQVEIPVLPQTLLLADLELDEFRVDLESLSQLILSDLGATLRILRASADGDAGAHGEVFRIADRICEMGLDACRAALFASCSQERISVGALHLWTHSREIGCKARSIAEQTNGMHPEQAYLVGLLHAIEELPSALGWKYGSQRRTIAAFGELRLAEEWRLPACFQEFVRERTSCGEGPWTELIRAAHFPSGSVSEAWVSKSEIRPLLPQAV